MKLIRKNIIGLVMVIGISFFMCTTKAEAVMLDFEGLGNLVPILDFYNGGPGGNFGVTFSSNAVGLIDYDNGGSGNFGGEPSPSTVLYFKGTGTPTLNIAAGFERDFSFYYSSPYRTWSIDIYADLIGTGTAGTAGTTTTTPEPATIFLIGSGLIGLVGLRRKFKNKTQSVKRKGRG